MPKKTTHWWRDPRFVIPSIVIPILTAAIGLMPRLLNNKSNETVTITMDLDDPRKPTAGLFNTFLEKTVRNANQAIQKAAAEFAESLSTLIQPSGFIDSADRTPIDVPVKLAEDGTVFIDQSFTETVALHLSRFSQFRDLESFLEEQRMSQFEQKTIDVSAFMVSGPEASEPERKMRAGVYRIILTAPGYHDASVYLELTEDGKLLTGSIFAEELTELTPPITMKLKPRSGQSAKLTIAIKALSECTVTSSDPKLEEICSTLQKYLMRELQQKGFEVKILEEGQKVGFDLNISKGMPPPQGLVFADLAIEVCCQWAN
jgi:hypothetical protein